MSEELTMKDIAEELKEDVMKARSIIRELINEAIDFNNENGLAAAHRNFRAIISQAANAAGSLEALIWLGKVKKSD
ncbi:MAG: hypothetical protein DRN68_09490 [Thaumarchaeota archaeon]|mgnify:CR=1 FL=1|nr:MAG: hypothetical protein DRN68_09490 [Nitrososphaerota archaeon]